MLINELELHTTDLSAQKAFYTNVLGLRATAETDKSFTVQVGTSRLTFVTTHLVNAAPRYHFAFNIPCNQAQNALQWLKTRVTVLPANADGDEVAELTDWAAEAVYFNDPSGNIVECIARNEYHPATSTFGSDSLLCISEVGFVSKTDAKTMAASLREKYDITSYQRGSNNTDFWALGADNGLFVVVANGRNWFPTETAAQPFPMKIGITNRKNIACEVEVF